MNTEWAGVSGDVRLGALAMELPPPAAQQEVRYQAKYELAAVESGPPAACPDLCSTDKDTLLE
jgi:hypothetical protein